MKRIFLLFGSTGDLGSGVLERMLKKNFDRIYQFNRKDITVDNDPNKIEAVRIPDFTSEDDMVSAYDKVVVDSETLLFAFSTVGGFYANDFIETEYSDWKNSFDLNLNTSFLIARGFLYKVRECAGGSICFTSAMTSLKAEEKKSAYGASKSALNYLVKTIALEAVKYKATANVVAPYILDTPENRQWVDDPGKMVKPSDIGDLLGDIFDNYNIINGNIIELTGDIRSR
ncbi:MAG: SDR family oxidoreductase [Melioribacteraceae bacterium]|nr:SDR family oxidoreductase [Melioribacteraceae bacterium]